MLLPPLELVRTAEEANVISQFKTGALISYATIAFNILSGLLYTPWMIACIGNDDYALYTLVMSVINFFMMDLGLGSAVSRFLSKYYAEGKREQANAFMGIVYWIYALISFVVFILLFGVFLFSDSIYSTLSVEQMEKFRLLYAIAAAYAVVSLPLASFDGILVSNEQFVGMNLCNLIQKIATVLLIVVCLIFGSGVYALVVVNAAIGLLSLAVKGLIIIKSTDLRPRFGYWNASEAKNILGFSGWVMVSQICQRFIFSVMPSIIAVVSSTWQVALFGLASSLEGYLWTVANAINGMFMPRVSQILERDRSAEELQAFAIKMGRLQLYLVGLIVIGFASMGGIFINCWVGSGYEPLYTCALLLFIPSLLELPQLVAGTAIIAAGEVRLKAIVFIAMALVNVTLGLFFSRFFGAIGSCAAICIAYFVRTLGMDVIYHRRLGMRLASFFFSTYGSWVFPALLTLLAGILFRSFAISSGWLDLALGVAFDTAVYCASMWLFSFNAYEKGLVMSIVRRGSR